MLLTDYPPKGKQVADLTNKKMNWPSSLRVASPASTNTCNFSCLMTPSNTVLWIWKGTTQHLDAESPKVWVSHHEDWDLPGKKNMHSISDQPLREVHLKREIPAEIYPGPTPWILHQQLQGTIIWRALQALTSLDFFWEQSFNHTSRKACSVASH